MQFEVKSLKLTTSSEPKHWGGVFCENGIFIVLEMEGSAESAAPAKGNEMLDMILTKITNYRERNISVLEEITNWAKQTAYIKTLILGFLTQDMLYLANLGAGNVLMVRDDRAGSILSSSGTCSGKIKAGDRLLLSSETFLAHIKNDKQQELLKSDNLTNAIEDIYPILVSKPGSAGATALVLEIENKKEESRQRKISDLLKGKWQNVLEKVRQQKNKFWQDEEDSKPKKTLLTIAVILILLLLASIFLNINHSASTSRQNTFRQTLDLVTHQYEEAVNLIDLNPVRARVLLSDSKLSLSQILAGFPKNSNEFKEINEWIAKIAEKEVAAYKIYKFTNVPLFFDLGLIKTEGTGSKTALFQKTAVILDTKNRVVYSLSLDTKQASIIAGGEVVKEAQTVGVHGRSAYLLNSDGIIQADLTAKSSKVVIKTDEAWGEIGQIAAFAGNLYLLDKKNNAVWKYIATDFGFSARAKYLNPDVKIPLGNAFKMVIDGSVWILADRETIFKFTSGQSDNFSFKGLSDTISDITSIFTSDEAKKLYVLDKNSKRILVFDKDGNYQEQYQWDELQSADDLAVSEGEKKIFVLVGSKIYAIDIK